MSIQENFKDARNIQAVRRFNRFYTRWLGILNEKSANRSLSLTEIRVLFELYYRHTTHSTEISCYLHLDASYLSRILRKFQKEELIASEKNTKDGRQTVLMLTNKGKELFSTLEKEQNHTIGSLLKNVAPQKQAELVKAMETIEDLLETPPTKPVSYLLRSHRPGDLGWIIHRHGVLYNKEYRYNQKFEAMVAEIAAKFLFNYDPTSEHCWIAEKDGEFAGSIAIVKNSDTQGSLRLFLVEPESRGAGIGKRLLEECIGFAKRAGYQKLSLSTHSELHAARRLYEQAGFIKIEQKPYQDLGRDNLIIETWELCLL